MLKKLCLTILLALTLLCSAMRPAFADPALAVRIAYLENGPFWLFPPTCQAFQKAMQQHTDIAASYPPELHASPGWDATPADMENEARRLFAAKPDLILAAGTPAVRALLAVNDGKTPILGVAIADPVAAGIMKSPTESAAPNFICEVIPNRWKNMYRVFHDVVGFEKMGMLYPEGEDGRAYSGIDEAIAVAKEAGFTVLAIPMPDHYTASCVKGIEKLHEMGADALFIGPLNCFDWTKQDLAPLFELVHGYGMPTFARDGSPLVQHGALMGFSTWNFQPSGTRLAAAARSIFYGATPASLSMIGTTEPIIALNLQTTRELGLDLPFDVLVAADEVYDK